MSFSERRANLLRILEIETNIKDIEHSKDYLISRRDLKALEHFGSGGGRITISSPEDLDRTVEVRKNSPELGEYIARYKERMRGDKERIDSLNIEKTKLRAELMGNLVR
jgi:hypothetical protein